MNTYRFSDQRADVDLIAVHQFLSQSYWAKDIPLETVARSVEHSLCFSVFVTSTAPTSVIEAQVGFARVISDRACFAYLADVYILPEYRGKGLSKTLMAMVLQHPELQGLRRTLLATRDAHSLYAQFGFRPLVNADSFMEVWQPNVYDNK